MQQRSTLIASIVATLVTLLTALITTLLFRHSNAEIRNYDDCIAGGNPVQETYPARCLAPDGRIFTGPLNANNLAPQ